MLGERRSASAPPFTAANGSGPESSRPREEKRQGYEINLGNRRWRHFIPAESGVI